MTSRTKYVLALSASASAVAFAGLPTTPASAADPSNIIPWSAYFDPIGTCGTQVGLGVTAMQANLWADHAYGNQNTSNVDGVIGPNTTNAIKTYQGWNNRPQNGCLDWQTMNAMWAHRDYLGVFGSPQGGAWRFDFVGQSARVNWAQEMAFDCWNVGWLGWQRIPNPHGSAAC